MWNCVSTTSDRRNRKATKNCRDMTASPYFAGRSLSALPSHQFAVTFFDAMGALCTVTSAATATM